MDNDILNNKLAHILKTYHAANVRYQHFALSSRDMGALSQLSLALRDLLPEYSFWSGGEPENGNAPPALCSRREFIHATFKDDLPGLIITQPNFWLQRWHHLDRQAFWSALSSRHGGHHVIIIFPESDEFKRLNLNYFNSNQIDNLPVTLWDSSKKQLF
ncbi:MAG: hypothetical protein GQ583_01955 [Methyloprofundus sp.]|nr:hypothetical protein [Methyloprofundus sp.]